MMSEVIVKLKVTNEDLLLEPHGALLRQPGSREVDAVATFSRRSATTFGNSSLNSSFDIRHS